jgi:hypothetical protein
MEGQIDVSYLTSKAWSGRIFRGASGIARISEVTWSRGFVTVGYPTAVIGQTFHQLSGWHIGPL